MPSLGRPGPEQIRKAAKRLKKRTGCHPDRLKLRHILSLPEVGLECLPGSLEVMGTTGLLPTAQQLIAIQLYPSRRVAPGLLVCTRFCTGFGRSCCSL